MAARVQFNTAVQKQTALAADLKSKQLLLLGFVVI